jgi:hypothetical protein
MRIFSASLATIHSARSPNYFFHLNGDPNGSKHFFTMEAQAISTSTPFPNREMHCLLSEFCIVHTIYYSRCPRIIDSFPPVYPTAYKRIIPMPERTAVTVNPTARTLPASKLEPNVIPLASFFFDDVAAPPVAPVTGLLAVAC